MTFPYHFLSSLLPELQIGMKPELPYPELKQLLKENLYLIDYKKVRKVRLLYDIENMRSFWKGEPLSPYGNLDENELEEALLTGRGLPSYIYDFLEQYKEDKERIARFPALIVAYFQHEIAHATGFLRSYLQFEREWRLVATGFRAKALGRDLSRELQDEDPDDFFVAQMLAQRDAKYFEPPNEEERLKAIFTDEKLSPLQLHQALCEYRFAKIDELTKNAPFSIDRILGYLTQLILVEQWLELDKQKGSKTLFCGRNY